MDKIFIDSSIIIEFQKENTEAVLLLSEQGKTNNLFYINPIVVSEVVYILRKKIKYTVAQTKNILKGISVLAIDNQVVEIAYQMMHYYNLKPNDAIIIATCKYHKIPNLLTMDNDFTQVCLNENIKIIK